MKYSIESIFNRYCVSVASLLLLSLSACASAPLKQAASLEPPIKQENITLEAEATPIDKPIVETSSLFLKDLIDTDLEKVKEEARRTTLPIWENINKRSEKVQHRVQLTLNELGAPKELLFVPVAESGYNPYALSPAGAFGLWQLMPRTAKELGAHSTNGINARRNIETSTQAAAKYLLSLHDRFNDWPLAICAYNLGPWGVERRLKKKPWDYSMGLDKLPFPAETRHYVKQILGMIALEQEGELTFNEPMVTETIAVNAPIDLTQLESKSGLEKNELFQLNPGLEFQHYINKDLTLHLPKENIVHLENVLSETPDIFKPKYISIKIKSGDSLWTIAKRHKTTVRELQKLNPKLSSTLTIGKHITVPASSNPSTVSNKANPLLAKGRRIHYKVRQGDSLWTIAKKFGTSMRSIARTNQIGKNQLIRPGDRLWIVARYKPS